MQCITVVKILSFILELNASAVQGGVVEKGDTEEVKRREREQVRDGGKREGQGL